MSRTLAPEETTLKSSIPDSTGRKLYIVFDGQDESAPRTGENNLIEFNRADVADTIKRTFGTYINQQTSINQFQVQSTVRNFRSYDAFGNQSNFLQHDADEQKSYLGEFGEGNEAARKFEKSYSGLLNTEGDEFKLNKTFQGSGLSDGDKILKNPSTFAVRINTVLEDNNTNNPNNKLVGDNTQTDDDFVLGSISFRNLGQAGNRRKFPNATQGSSKDSLTIKELKTMGLLTMLQATGEVNQPNISDPNAQDAIASYGIATTMAPGVSRIGGRINVSRFSPTNVIKAIKPDYNKQEHTNFINGKAVYSYGNVNSYFVPFDGLTNVPSVISATILFSTVIGALEAFSFLSLVRSGTKELTTGGDTENRRQWLGKYKISPSNNTGNISNVLLNQKNILEFVPIEHEFFKCLNKGITVFFGMPGISSNAPRSELPSAIGRNVVAGASQLTKLSGYYNTVLRNVVRDINNLAFNPFENTESRSPDAMDIRNNADPVAMVKKLNNSSLLKLINILLTIGDKALLAEDKQISSTEGLGFLTNSDIDTIEEQLGSEFAILPNTTTVNPSVLRVKNRLKNGHLAMSNGTLKSMYLMPINMMQTIGKISDAGDVGKFKSRLQNNNIVVERPEYISNGRIKAEIVKKMEDYLELDYLPFYFHDIRTNEITSFHAFIENINDSITAEYVETEGYGRIGKIHTYKNTNRDISFSFKLFATNDQDFDDMWVKINKLATLLYPQWTEGRKINFPTTNGQTYKFIQPFSQLPGASPLVRIRVGDLFKTNYSKLAVARLFGFGNGIEEGGSFNIQGMDREAERIGRESTQRMQMEQRANELFDQQRRGIFAPGSTVKLRVCNGRFANGGEFRFQEGYIANVLSLNGHVVSLSNNGNIFTTQVDSIVPDIELIKRDISGETNSNAEAAQTSQTEQNNSRQNSETINTFFDSERNYIMKAFESTKGRGLAGFIKSFKLNFENATWMTDLVNCRAPKLVTIDVDFAPIHDIQPGLDSNGFMTAPIWNVGKAIGELSDQDEFRKADENIKTATSYITPSYARQGSDNNAADQRSLSERITRTTIRE